MKKIWLAIWLILILSEPSYAALQTTEGEGIDLTTAGSQLIISSEEATSSNKGAASFDETHFAVTSGDVEIANDGVALGTKTTGDYVANLTPGSGILVSGASSGEGVGHEVSISLSDTPSASITTESYSGLEFNDDPVPELMLITGCDNGEVLAWDSTNAWWECSTVASGGFPNPATEDLDMGGNNINNLAAPLNITGAGGGGATVNTIANFIAEGFPEILFSAYSDTPYVSGVFRGDRYRGTIASPAAVQNGDAIFRPLSGRGWDGNSIEEGGLIRFFVDGVVSDGAMPMGLDIYTRPLIGAEPLARITIKNDGKVGIGTASPTANLSVSGTATVSGRAYNATSWNGSAAVPTEDAIRDKIEAISLSTSAGGSDTQCQRNTAGSLGGISGCTSDGTNIAISSTLTLTGTVNATGATLVGFPSGGGGLSSADINTYSELDAIVADAVLTHNGLIDTSAEIAAIVGNETGTGSLVLGTSPLISTPNLRGVINFVGTAVDDDSCTGQQGQAWWDSVDNQFEFCNPNSGVPTTLGGVAGTATGVFYANGSGSPVTDTGLVFADSTDILTVGVAIQPSGVNPFKVGSASTTAITLQTDSTGNAEIVLPDSSIGPSEIQSAGQIDEYVLTFEATGPGGQPTTEWQVNGGGGGGSGTPGGADTQIQRNAAGLFAGITGFISTGSGALFQDDIFLNFGTSSEWKVEYDDATDDQLIFSTTKTSAITTNDAMLLFLFNSGKNSQSPALTLNQKLIAIADGPQDINDPQGDHIALFNIDAEGDLYTKSTITGTHLYVTNGIDVGNDTDVNRTLITIRRASTDAEIEWDEDNDLFSFSHPISVPEGDTTFGEDTTVTVEGTLTIGGTQITLGVSGQPGCVMYRDTDNAGWTECDALNGTVSCSIDADGICD